MEQSVAFRVAKEIEAETGIETRTSVLGYLQRGGAPSPYDMLLATKRLQPFQRRDRLKQLRRELVQSMYMQETDMQRESR